MAEKKSKTYEIFNSNFADLLFNFLFNSLRESIFVIFNHQIDDIFVISNHGVTGAATEVFIKKAVLKYFAVPVPESLFNKVSLS